MISESNQRAFGAIDLLRWRKLPGIVAAMGFVGVAAGAVIEPEQLGFSWLTAFVFHSSICLGALFLVIVHHLFDAAWSAPLRRLCEHAACLVSPWMLLLFLPLAALAPLIYGWAQEEAFAGGMLPRQWPLLTVAGFCAASVICIATWRLIAWRLRYWSLRQDETGEAFCTCRMRRWAALGAVVLAPTLTLASVLWVTSLQHEWHSTIYGVYCFAGSAWVTVATVYVLAAALRQHGILAAVLRDRHFYYLGTLLLAFTVFYAYIHFSQYFVIWNANVPDETLWYVMREAGGWRNVGLAIVFGHFLAPFLILLRIDVKLDMRWMAPLCVWVWLMHYLDIYYNVMPVRRPDGPALQWLWLDLACMLFMAGVLTGVFRAEFARHAPYPVRDPRLGEALEQDGLASPANHTAPRTKMVE